MFCFSRRGNELLKEVRRGFGLEGLQGLEGRINDDSRDGPPDMLVTRQREEYRTPASNLVLPAFMILDVKDGWRLVRYEADILSRVSWDEIDLSALDDLVLDAGREGEMRMSANLEEPIPEPLVGTAALPAWSERSRWRTG